VEIKRKVKKSKLNESIEIIGCWEHWVRNLNKNVSNVLGGEKALMRRK
jgi:hypothetical protein